MRSSQRSTCVIDRPQVQLREQLTNRDGVRLDGGQRHGPSGAVKQLEPARVGQRPSAQRVLGPDQDPVAASAVTTHLYVAGERLHPWLRARGRPSRDLGQRVPGVVGEAQPRVALQARAQDLRGALIER